MGNRFYIILISLLTCSALLLGLSYSKQSANGVNANLHDSINDTYRVIYSTNDKLNTRDNNVVKVSLINMKNVSTSYALVLDEVINSDYENVFYTIDGDNYYALTDNIIDLGYLNAYGSNGDTKQYSISLKGTDSYEFDYSVIEYAYLDEVSYGS